MFIWAALARHAKYARLTRILCVFLIVQSLVAMPVGISMLRDEPAVLYPRLHGGPHFEFFDRSWDEWINVEGDEHGFVGTVTAPLGVEWPMAFDTFDYEREQAYRIVLASAYDAWEDEGVDVHHFLIAITPEYIFFRDSNAHLVVSTGRVSAWSVEEMALEELFNHLALHNRYISGIVAPTFMFVFIVFLIMQTLIFIAAVWLFGHWQKLSGDMTRRERIAVCTFASVPAGLIAFAIGIFMPVIHVFIFQLLLLYFSYKAIKEFLNADNVNRTVL